MTREMDFVEWVEVDGVVKDVKILGGNVGILPKEVS